MLGKLDFLIDKHGYIDARGVPVCTIAKLEGTTVSKARKRCRGALVGKGLVKAEVNLPGQPTRRISSPVSIFNGPPKKGMPSLIAHAHETVPEPKTLLVPIEIEKVNKGRYGFRVQVEIPPIADGYGAPTLAEATIGRTFKRGGRKVGYLNAYCAAGQPPGPGQTQLHQRRLLPRDADLAVPRVRLKRCLLGACALAALVVAASASGEGALVEVDNLVLRADGGFQPRQLPKRRYAPIEFQGHARLASKDGTRPLPLREAVINFDRDGRLGVAGLPICPPQRIAAASTEEARRLCSGAIVGSGRVEATISLAGGAVIARSPLTIFNGPREDGHPTAVLHARTTVPGTQVFAIVVPIERRRGDYRYRATLDVPPIAAGLGSLTYVDVKIGRRYRSGGKSRSYVSARCGDDILRTRGRFTFEDGTVIEGSVEKFCRALP